jgi:uncharacterized protein DUF2786
MMTINQGGPAMRIEFETCDFEFAHGRAPKGRGSWVFSVWRYPGYDRCISVPGSTTYTEAKRWMRQACRAFGISDVTFYVQS